MPSSWSCFEFYSRWNFEQGALDLGKFMISTVWKEKGNLREVKERHSHEGALTV